MKFGGSTSSALLSLLVAASGLLVVAAGGGNNNNNNYYDGAILVLGDSWASLSGSYLSDVCSLASSSSLSFSVTNNGISGSTASQWASNNYASKSFNNNNKYNYDYDYVWLSIGGNDFNCDETYHESIAENIVTVISDIVSSPSNENIKILYTGYGYPSANICGNNYGGNNDDGDSDGLISIFEDFAETILDAIQSSAYGKYVYAMDVSTLFVTEDSYPLSDSYYYADSIHINGYGYDKLFGLDDIQYFFGCISEKSGSGSSSSWTSSAYGRSNNGVGFGSKAVMMGIICVSLAALSLYVIKKKNFSEKYKISGLSGTLLSSNNNKQQQPSVSAAVDVI